MARGPKIGTSYILRATTKKMWLLLQKKEIQHNYGINAWVTVGEKICD